VATDCTRSGAVALLAAAVFTPAGRGPQEADVTPDEAKETLTSIVHEAVELLDTVLSFSTGPGKYSITGTSSCVPGNADQIRDEEYVG
jgi:hypothetical protein